MVKHVCIRQIYEMVNQQQEVAFSVNGLVKKIELLKTRFEDDYANITIQDNTGEANTVVFDISKQFAQEIKEGTIIHINHATASVYNEHTRIRTKGQHIQVIPPSHEAGNPMLYVNVAPLDTAIGVKKIQDTIAEIQNANARECHQIVLYLLQKYGQPYSIHVSSVNQAHNYVGGLLYEVYRVLHAAQPLYSLYTIDEALLKTAILLYPIGKVQTIQNPYQPHETIEHALLGDMIITQSWIDEACHTLNIDTRHPKVIQLKHILLAATTHSMPPKTKEAILLKNILTTEHAIAEFEQEERKMKLDGKSNEVAYSTLLKQQLYVN